MSRMFYCINRIFESSVTAKAKLVYIYLCRMAGRNAVSFPSRKTIAAACGLSVESVKRATKELAMAGFIEKNPRHCGNGRQTSNLYLILSDKSEPHFYCESAIFDIDIPTNTKLVFIYIRRMCQQETCFPSYSMIAVSCGLSAGTAQKAVKALLESGYITKEHQYRENGGRSNNRYQLRETHTETLQESRCFFCIVLKTSTIRPYFRNFLDRAYPIRAPPIP